MLFLNSYSNIFVYICFSEFAERKYHGIHSQPAQRFCPVNILLTPLLKTVFFFFWPDTALIRNIKTRKTKRCGLSFKFRIYRI